MNIDPKNPPKELLSEEEVNAFLVAKAQECNEKLIPLLNEAKAELDIGHRCLSQFFYEIIKRDLTADKTRRFLAMALATKTIQKSLDDKGSMEEKITQMMEETAQKISKELGVQVTLAKLDDPNSGLLDKLKKRG